MRIRPCLLKWFVSLGLILNLILTGSLNTIVSGKNWQQEPQDSIKITIRVKDKSLEIVMTEIYLKTGLNFHYDKTDLNLKKKVTLICNKTPIDQVLAMLIEQTGFTFTRIGNKIIVGTTDKPGKLSTDNPADHISPEIDITGTVRDSKGNHLQGVTIQIRNTNKGTQTNADASFRIKAGPGAVLVFSSIGYTTREIPVLTTNEMDVVLHENIKSLNELVVTALGLQKKRASYPTPRSNSAAMM